MEPPPFPPPHPQAPPPPLPPPPPHPPPPPPNLASTLAHLRSLLSAAASALAALPTPLLPHPTTTTPHTTIPSPPPTTTATNPLPPPASAVPLPLLLLSAPPFYSDCPSVVRVTPAPTPAFSSLPALLAAECADYSSSAAAPTPSPPPPRILASELGLLRRELDSWGAGVHHLPGSYSYAAARVAAAFRFGVPPRCHAELRWWVLASSPRYGVVIDAAVRDHVWLLVRLCLKAVAAEAGCSLERIGKGEDHEGLGFDPRAVRLECPRLVEGFSWLGAQLGVLYGESNGRFFAVGAVKEALLRMGYCLAIGVGDCAGVGGGMDSGVADGGGGEKGSHGADVVLGPVFLSQVAAAIAALYERFSMEEKVKALQAQRPSNYQLLLEYSQALERGHLERSNRPNYRAVLEYDGILSRQVDNQVSGRTKTREELLAEERDYKRRRASYRGKKVKRNPTEILRDIIDDHMEEIKQAGGIGCLVGTPPDITQNMLKSNSHEATYEGKFDPVSISYDKGSSYDKAALGSRSPSFENSPHVDSLGIASSRSHDRRDSYKNLRYQTHVNRYQNVSDCENKWIRGPENEIDQSYPHQHESNRHQRNSNDNRKYSDKYKKYVSDYRFDSSDCTAWSPRSQRSSVTENNHMLGHSDRSKISQKQHRSVSVTQDQFSDRYNPQSTYSDIDPPTSMVYDVSEEKREIYHDEVHRNGHHERKCDHHC